MKRPLSILSVLGILLLSFSWLQEFDFEVPQGFPEPVYNFEMNPLNEETIQLGRALFYDPALSRDSTISCASCHSPFNAFAHSDHALSHGINDQIGIRNAPALFNLAWQKEMMLDGAVNHLDMQALAPITSETEMGETLENVIQKISRQPRYRGAFANSYGDSAVTGERVLKALSQFQLTLISAGAKYDAVKRGEKDFTDQEESGYQLYKEFCSECHTEPLFSSFDFKRNGLPPNPELNDSGRYMVTGVAKDLFSFKVPSLRNLSYSAPYMHDGRVKNLRKVINHYTEERGAYYVISDLPKEGLQLSEHQKTNLIAFLLTLDDEQFVFNEDHRFPRSFFFTEASN